MSGMEGVFFVVSTYFLDLDLCLISHSGLTIIGVVEVINEEAMIEMATQRRLRSLGRENQPRNCRGTNTKNVKVGRV